MVDTSAIHRVIATARRRLKCQKAFEWAAIVAIPATICAAIAVVLARQGWTSAATTTAVLIASTASILGCVLVAGFRRISDVHAAAAIDRHCNLSDRLATACTFERVLLAKPQHDVTTESMMRLAIQDATDNVHNADPVAATPFQKPRYGVAALVATMLSAAAATIDWNPARPHPILLALHPAAAAANATVVATGTRLLTPAGSADTFVFLGTGDSAIALEVAKVTSQQVAFSLPANAPIGPTTINLRVGHQSTQPLSFEVLSATDPRGRRPDSVSLTEDDVEYANELVADIRNTAEATEDLALQELARELEEIVKNSDDGNLTKKDLLQALNKAEARYFDGTDDSVQESIADLKKAGKELKKDKITKALGNALESGDLRRAQDEINNLATKLDNELGEAAQKKLGNAMEKAADAMSNAENGRNQALDKRIAAQKQKRNQTQRRHDNSRSDTKRQELARRLQKQSRELERLERKRKQSQDDPNKRELKRLRRTMSAAAKQLKQPKQRHSRREMSKTMRDIARSTGKVSQDKRKMANKPKVSSQLSDLKEAMRRAKRKGKQGPNEKFGRNQRRKDFSARAQGRQGQRGAWKPKQGSASQQTSSKGNQTKGQEYGDGHDPNVMGKKTAKSGNTVDESLQGIRGQGPSTRETILTAAQKGFANRAYEKVFVRYKTIVEEDIKAEKVPSGYRYYVKRYFQNIKFQQN